MDEQRIRSRFAGSLLGTMAGDALGAPVEGWDCARLNAALDELAELNAPHRALFDAVFGLIGGGSVPPGHARYTDDTQMTLGVAESLAHVGRFDGADMARRFAENFEGHRGYGPGAMGVLLALRNGAPWTEAAQGLFGGQGSFGNGAAMRVGPIGLFYADDATERRRVAEVSASITHTHPLGKEGAVLQAAAVAAAFRRDPAEPLDTEAFLDEVRSQTRDDLHEYRQAFETLGLLLKLRPGPEEVSETLGSGIEAHRSVPAALYSFLTHSDSFRDAVTYAVRLGDDTDTVGAMCGAIAGAFHGVEAIPAEWLAALENGAKGRDYALRLSDSLHKATMQRRRAGIYVEE